MSLKFVEQFHGRLRQFKVQLQRFWLRQNDGSIGNELLTQDIETSSLMPHTIKPAPEHYTGLRSANRAQRRSLVMFTALVVCATAFVAGLFALQGHWQQVRELTWSSAQGTVVDGRQVLAVQVGGNLGGGMLYQTQVLARYTTEGSPREQWITVSQGPRGVDDAGFQTFRFKGRPCIVRWNPSKPEELVVEIT